MSTIDHGQSQNIPIAKLEEGTINSLNGGNQNNQQAVRSRSIAYQRTQNQLNETNNSTNKEVIDQPTLSTYIEQPIATFGMNLLLKMGFKSDQGIGKSNKKLVAPYELKGRPKQSGLGVINVEEEQAAKKLNQKNKLVVVGDTILIEEGQHCGLMGIITLIKDKTNCSVQLKNSGSEVKVKLSQLKRLTAVQIREKEQEDKSKRNIIQAPNSNNNQDRESIVVQPSKSKLRRLKWVIPNIRVKIIAKQSDYYLKKPIVSDVLSEHEFQLLLLGEHNSSNTYIRNLTEKDIQTVIPPIGGLVIVLPPRGGSSSHKIKGASQRSTQLPPPNTKGHLYSRNKDKCQVVIRTFDMEMYTVNQDDVSEFVG